MVSAEGRRTKVGFLKRRFQRASQGLADLATRISRAELLLAFLSAASLGGFLNSLQQFVTGEPSSPIVIFTVCLGALTVITLVVWWASRRLSLDLGVVVVFRRTPLRNREGVSRALRLRTREYSILEAVDNFASTHNLTTASSNLNKLIDMSIAKAVGRPKILIALSASDGSAFIVGWKLRGLRSAAELQVMTLPTGSREWPPHTYAANGEAFRRLFEVDDMSGTRCPCDLPAGVAVIDPLRSPGGSSEVVINGLLNEGRICCSNAVHLARVSGADLVEALSSQQILTSIDFVRSRARWLAMEHRQASLFLVVGPEAAFISGHLLGDLCEWVVYDFDQSVQRWKERTYFE